MKQVTYILLVIGVVQLLLTVCAVEGKKHRSDKSDRSERGRAAKKGAAKKKGGGKLESEEYCTKGEECQSGNCCPLPSDPKKKACFKEDCNVAKIGVGKNANPPIHEWETSTMWYKVFIRDYSNVLEAIWKCCEWKKHATLALVNTDPIYDNVYAELTLGMKTKQNANKADSSIEATVRIDGNNVDKERFFTYVNHDDPDEDAEIDKKFWYASRMEPNRTDPLMNCVGIRYYSGYSGPYKFATVPCYTPLPFLCEASKTVNKNAGGSKKKVPDAGKKKAPDAGKKKAPDAGKKKKGK